MHRESVILENQLWKTKTKNENQIAPIREQFEGHGILW